MQTPKGRIGSLEVSQKVSPRVARQLKTSLDSDSASPSNRARTPKEKNPKVGERHSPRSPVTEKKRPSRISELESQISQLQEELKSAKEQLIESESWKKQVLEDAKDSQKQLFAMSSKLEESQRQLLELSASEEAHVISNPEVLEEQDQQCKSEPDFLQQQQSPDSAALAAALNEIQQLKVQLEAAQNKLAESSDLELRPIKVNLMDALSLVENLKSQLKDSKVSEAQAQELASETLRQLETAKKAVETLRSDGVKAIEAYNSIVTELEESRAHVNLLEEHVCKLKGDLENSNCNQSQELLGNCNTGLAVSEIQGLEEAEELKAEIGSLKVEVGRLRSALEASDMRSHEEQIHASMQIRSAYELVEQMKFGSVHRETELEGELEQAKALIEELRANLMDKETELQGISEENEVLNLKLEKILSSPRDTKLENELGKLTETVADLRASMMDKETELQNILEENGTLQAEIGKWEANGGKKMDEVIVELEQARAAEREALIKLGLVMEEADRSTKRVARVTEQLEAAQAANSEMEAELRRLKVQSDQWRKAAEAAAAMLSAGNNGKFMDRTASLDSNYSPVAGKLSPYNDDTDDDVRKKNGSVLKKIGVLWKRQQK